MHVIIYVFLKMIEDEWFKDFVHILTTIQNYWLLKWVTRFYMYFFSMNSTSKKIGTQKIFLIIVLNWNSTLMTLLIYNVANLLIHLLLIVFVIHLLQCEAGLKDVNFTMTCFFVSLSFSQCLPDHKSNNSKLCLF